MQDGNLVLNIDLGFHLWITVKVKLANVTLPNYHSTDSAERDKALSLKYLVESTLAGRALYVTTRENKKDKYDNYEAEILFTGPNGKETNLATLLLKERLVTRD